MLCYQKLILTGLGMCNMICTVIQWWSKLFLNSTKSYASWTLLYVKGFYAITLVCQSIYPSVSRSLYLRYCPLVFLTFCMKLGHHKGTKAARFLKKSIWGHKWGNTSILEHFWCCCPYLCIQSLKLHIHDKLNII